MERKHFTGGLKCTRPAKRELRKAQGRGRRQRRKNTAARRRSSSLSSQTRSLLSGAESHRRGRTQSPLAPVTSASPPPWTFKKARSIARRLTSVAPNNRSRPRGSLPPPDARGRLYHEGRWGGENRWESPDVPTHS